MVAYVFDTILQRAARAGMDSMAANSRTWFRSQASKMSTDPNKLLASDQSRLVNKPTLGNMYMFRYDPKHKDDLPYYDTFPLIFPFKSTTVFGQAGKGPGFYGLNLHYLPLRLRARLMDSLYMVSSNGKTDEVTKMRISYRILNGTARIKFFEPCIKQYLFSHVRSKFFEIAPSEWNMALFMNLQKFVGATSEQVWKDSIGKIGAN